MVRNVGSTSDYYQTGTEIVVGGGTVSPVKVYATQGDPGEELKNVKSVSAGSYHSCAILLDGSVHCWGGNMYGGLGNGESGFFSYYVPVAVPLVSSVKEVALGDWHTCALQDDGEVYCWGYNNRGQLGIGDDVVENFNPTPTKVSGLTDEVKKVISITAGHQHTCALFDNGTVKCWGGDTDGALADSDNDDTDKYSPVYVLGMGSVESFSAGENFTCVLLTLDDQRAYCWGANDRGQLGNGGDPFGQIEGLDNAVSLDTGQSHACALLNGGTLMCWGSDNYGQTGDAGVQGQTEFDLSPVSVLNIEGVEQVTTGKIHSCALLLSGDVQCWGHDLEGQLGDGNGEGFALNKLVPSVPIVFVAD